MTQALSLPVAGLMTNPGPFTAAPDGGMTEAQNVVVVRPGVLEPRPGTTRFEDTTIGTGDAIYVDDDGDTWVVGASSGLVRKNGTTTITGPDSFERGKIRFAPTGGRALFTTEDGVCTLPGQLASPASGSSTVAYRAGMPQPYTPRVYLTAATGTSVSATDTTLAYRFTLRRRLANGTIIESAPSSPVPVRSLAAWALGNQNVQIGDPAYPYRGWRTSSYPGFGDLIAGDELCVYRSPRTSPGDAIPSDEMRLRTVITYDAVTGTFPAFTDTLPDASWSGASLYTNETQEGAILANYRPQYARDIALYNGMTFYAGAKTAQRVTLNLKRVGDGATANSPSETLTTWAFASGDIAIGTNTILTISATDIPYMSVGQVITRNTNAPGTADAYFPADTYITAVGAASVTVSANALATQAGASLKAWDWVQTTIGGVDTRMYVVQAVLGATPARFFYPYDLDIPYIMGGPPSMENGWNGTTASASGYPNIQLRVSGGRPFTYAAGIISSYEDMTVSFEGTNPSASSFTVKSTKPLAWDRYVDSVTGVTSAQSGGVAELQWSKINEPEHCPLPYRNVVGDAAYAIRRIAVARNSLLVFKDDGLYQVFGRDPGDLQFELLDRTLVIPAPSSSADEQSKLVGSLGDVVYAMTTRGPMACTDGGGAPVGLPILETLRRTLGNAYGSGDALIRGMMIDAQNSRVGFSINASSNGTTYVLDIQSGIWTLWTLPASPRGFATKRSTGEPTFCADSFIGTFVNDRRDLDGTSITVGSIGTYDSNSSAAAITINTVTGTGPYTVTFSASVSGLVAGDTILKGATYHTVIEVLSGTQVITQSAPSTGAGATILRAYECRCVWLARPEGNIGAEKHWRSILFGFELATRIGLMSALFRGYRNTVAGEVSVVLKPNDTALDTSALTPAIRRTFVPQSVGRDWALQVGFTVRQAGVWFSTSGVSILFAPVTPDKVAP